MQKINSRGFHERRVLIVFALLFAGLLCFNIWRAPYGGLHDDEAFYLAVPYRMMQGDSFILHEWNMAQMFGFITLPLVRLFVSVTGSTDGIVLSFRYIYVLVHAAVSLFIFLRLRKHSLFGAVAASCIYQLYNFSFFMALGYYILSTDFLLISCLIMALNQGKAWEHLLAGLSFALAVLACPFLILIYLAYSLAVLVFRLWRKAPQEASAIMSVKSWLIFSAACAFMALLFFIRIAIYGELSMLLQVMPSLLNDDYYDMKGPVGVIYNVYASFYKSHSHFKLILAAGVLLCAVILIDKKRFSHRPFYLAAVCVLTVYYALPYILTYRHSNYLIFFFSIIGFVSFLLCEKKNYRLFFLLFVPGAMYWLCMSMSSNLGFYTLAGSGGVSMVASMVFIAQLFGEMYASPLHAGKLSRIFSMSAMGVAVIACLLLSAALFQSRFHPPSSSDFRALDTKISTGATKGIISTAEEAALTELEYHELEALRNLPEGHVLYYGRDSLRSIEDTKPSSQCNMWFSFADVDSGVEALFEYWGFFPERFPDYIYIDKEEPVDEILAAFEGRGMEYTKEELETGIILHTN